jgi:hypothetical protein
VIPLTEDKMLKEQQEQAAADAQKLLEELDRESAYRKPGGLWGKLITLLLALYFFVTFALRER